MASSPIIIDIPPGVPAPARNLDGPDTQRENLIASLTAPINKKSLPTHLLYDDRGLELYDDITTQIPDQYYLFPCEESILTNSSLEIGKVMFSGAAGEGDNDGRDVFELGSGSLRKTSHLLSALSSLSPSDGVQPKTAYYALDLVRSSLESTLGGLAENPEITRGIALRGLAGSFDDGIAFAKAGGFHDTKADSPEDSLHLASPDHRDDEFEAVGTKYTMRPRRKSFDVSSDSTHSSRSSYRSTPTSESSPPLSPCVAPVRDTQPEAQAGNRPLHMLFVGSSLGNFPPAAAAKFLSSLPLRPGTADTLLLGLDARNDPEVVRRAYCDDKGVTTRFIMNGLKVAGRTLVGDELGDNLFEEGKWEYVGRYNEQTGAHEGYYNSKVAQTLTIPGDPPRSISFEKDELIHIEFSYKYSTEDAHALFAASDLRLLHTWSAPRPTPLSPHYSMYLLARPPFQFPLGIYSGARSYLSDSNSEQLMQKGDAPVGEALSMDPAFVGGVPTMNDWAQMWKLWDTVTVGMISPEMMHHKPIDLRHKCLFYLGHIPAFLDINLSKVLQEPHTEPVHFKDIFERGIDPHVDDPTQIHPHSHVPEADDEWPTLESILEFRDRVRARVARLYADCEAQRGGKWSKRMGRVWTMVYEHEAMHSETLLYMLFQCNNPIPPPGFHPPAWKLLPPPETSAEEPSFPITPPATQITIPTTKITLGHDDPESADHQADEKESDAPHEYGWDNESPKREVAVPGKARIEGRCVSNAEYRAFWESEGKKKSMPASWIMVNNELRVRTLYGPAPFSHAAHWPLIASYDELSSYAAHKGGRLPTEPELRWFMDTHLGSAESNLGFKHWGFIEPVEPGSGKRGHNGGVWELTSTIMDEHEGYERSELYPGYSSDFFDDMHHVVIGGSFATIPRMAQRRSFRNFYQHNYPYAWTGGRIVYDDD
ncbi:hypothetical protein BOTBODRAFT_100423 [Botryobasidium botryosum FD-172 SS1]|uniref:DUF323 domain-containing protein n=1 Tax=Botryobasidium botryosum (strain FD-172 SS1) TaxID=930990 RepID=A0A067N9W3_BOTB1|nr:hypothetical protein BOTBODRAFT_100423 [Botryobasidium botryosum FD-172 SS1]